MPSWISCKSLGDSRPGGPPLASFGDLAQPNFIWKQRTFLALPGADGGQGLVHWNSISKPQQSKEKIAFLEKHVFLVLASLHPEGPTHCKAMMIPLFEVKRKNFCSGKN